MYATSTERDEPQVPIIRYERTCAIAVPRTPSATAENSDFQPGACDGAERSANGSSTTNATTIETAASTGPPAPIRRPAYRFAAAYETDARMIAPVPSAPCQPPAGWTPARIATPARPTPTPTRRQPVERSLGTNQNASTATKIGTDEFATAATPE